MSDKSIISPYTFLKKNSKLSIRSCFWLWLLFGCPVSCCQSIKYLTPCMCFWIHLKEHWEARQSCSNSKIVLYHQHCGQVLPTSLCFLLFSTLHIYPGGEGLILCVQSHLDGSVHPNCLVLILAKPFDYHFCIQEFWRLTYHTSVQQSFPSPRTYLAMVWVKEICDSWEKNN